jgi:membrane dipeptidase
VAGITLVPDFLGGDSIDDVCRHIEYAVELMGSEHVAIGSDFDGAQLVRGINGVQDFPLLLARLSERGMAAADVENVGGESMRRLLTQVLPQ